VLECCILYSLRDRGGEGGGVGEGRSKLLQARPGKGYRGFDSLGWQGSNK